MFGFKCDFFISLFLYILSIIKYRILITNAQCETSTALYMCCRIVSANYQTHHIVNYQTNLKLLTVHQLLFYNDILLICACAVVKRYRPWWNLNKVLLAAVCNCLFSHFLILFIYWVIIITLCFSSGCPKSDAGLLPFHITSIGYPPRSC